MRKFNSLVEVLDFAIDRESETHLFYVRLADMVNKPELVKVIKDLATEEVEHRIKLEAVKAGEVTIGEEDIGALDIADYVPDVEPNPNMSYVDLLVVAMKKEKFSCKLYTDLAAIAQRQDLRDIFLKLAQEEAGHKLRFEFEYDLETFGGKRDE
ncbi:ferritin family protein [Planctomycetota bacterium]